MASNAAEALGAPRVAGCFVQPRGAAKSNRWLLLGGLLGAVIAMFAAKRVKGDPDFGPLGYLAVSAQEIALVRGKRGALKHGVTPDVVERVPRSEIASSVLGRGSLTSPSPLTITLTSGRSWELDVAKAHRDAATQVVNALGGKID